MSVAISSEKHLHTLYQVSAVENSRSAGEVYAWKMDAISSVVGEAAFVASGALPVDAVEHAVGVIDVVISVAVDDMANSPSWDVLPLSSV